MEFRKLLDDFCQSPFWDLNTTWNADNPDFTSCFEDTILTWIPCAFLWIFLPLEIYYLRHSKLLTIPFNIYNTVKLALIGLMCTLVLIDSIYYSFIQSRFVPALVVSSSVEFLTFTLFFSLTYANLKNGIGSSGILFLFSLLLAIFGAPKYRTYITKQSHFDDLPLITYHLYYPITLTVLILNCFGGAQPETKQFSTPTNVCPENRSSFLSKLWFAWFDGLVLKGYRKALEYDDLWSLDSANTSSVIASKFEKSWLRTVEKSDKNSYRIPTIRARISEENDGELFLFRGDNNLNVEYRPTRSKKTISVMTLLRLTFGVTFFLSTLLRIIPELLYFVRPLILGLLIDFVKGNEPTWHGYLYASLLLAFDVIQNLLFEQHYRQVYQIGTRIKTALIAVIYKKSLTMSNQARRNFTMGEILNLMSVDAHRFIFLTANVNDLWTAPLNIVLALFFLWRCLGPSILAGIAVMILIIPFNIWIASKTRNLMIKQMNYKDNRIKLINEILTGIKVLKLYAWEPSFEKQILHIRDKELKVLNRHAYLYAASNFAWNCTPFLVSLVTFGVYVLSSDENILDAKTVFVSLTLFNLIRTPLNLLPRRISTAIEASVAMKRINNFLNSADLNPNAVSHENKNVPLSIEKGIFSWDGPDGYPILRNINVQIKSGSLVAVVGPVGSGKSSLISAFLGEMFKLSGSVNTNGTIAYVPQQAWIQNATVRDNITLGEQLKGTQYDQVLSACALKPDLEILPAGDMTEIGEKGINLSGGQKQRISLARAAFYRADIYLLDDPLSAVDSHVGKHIFEHVIGPKGLLKHKTRILVTHSVTFLSQCDHIVVLKDGSVSESGTFKELTDKKGDFADYLLTYLKQNDIESDEADVNTFIKTLGKEQANEKIVRQRSRLTRVSESESVPSSNRQKTSSETEQVRKIEKASETVTGQNIIETEHAETGNVKWQVYAFYLSSVGAILTIATLTTNIAYQGFSIASNLWLSKWSSDESTRVNGTQNTSKTDFYLGVYAVLGLSQGIMTLLAALVQARGMLVASKYFHWFMLTHTLRAPLRFFDTTPIGRIINRFSKDIDTLDNNLPNDLQLWLKFSFDILSILLIISYSTPVFMIVMIPIGAFYIFLQRFYTATSRQLTRLESNSRSPIYSHFGETITGAQSIRAFGLQKKFIIQSGEKVDLNHKCLHPKQIADIWQSLRLRTFGNFITFFAALFAVIQRDSLSSGLVGLSISYALMITQALKWAVRLTSNLEADVVAVERVKEYGETPQEAPWEIENQAVSDKWPEKGEILFNNFRVRYREGLELVLKGLTFHVKGSDKVGIVGRTGAGKSSLTLSLFRIIESAGGSISIDGIDISTLGLHTLRSRITIIPQDPVLFSGTLRINLDPLEQYSDESLWSALEQAHLKTYISSLPMGLQHEVTEGGDNFSVGQRQLICLARALLRKTKVLVLDEATAAVDLETDDLIQTTIRNKFGGCTILTIAHRLNTVMDYDKIMVLDKGVMVEYDTPSALLASKNSIFYGMAAEAGLV